MHGLLEKAQYLFCFVHDKAPRYHGATKSPFFARGSLRADLIDDRRVSIWSELNPRFSALRGSPAPRRSSQRALPPSASGRRSV
jgi:hypothetical protein